MANRGSISLSPFIDKLVLMTLEGPNTPMTNQRFPICRLHELRNLFPIKNRSRNRYITRFTGRVNTHKEAFATQIIIMSNLARDSHTIS